jgi:sugar phosphate isomerase/epimerase
MYKFAISEMTTYRWSFEEDVQNYANAGIRAIGVWRQKLSDFGEEKGVELLAEKGLAVSSLFWAGGFTGSDGRSFSESIVDAQDAIRLAALLHAPCLTVYSGARGGHTNNHARRLLKSALKELVPAASEHGVELALEPVHPGCAADWTFLTDIREAISLLEELDHDRLKVSFDTYFFGHQPSILENLAEIAPRIAVVQLGDGKAAPSGDQNRCCLGEGTVPLTRIRQKLLDAGYAGYFEVKLLGEDVEAFSYTDLIERSKEAFESWESAGEAT